MLNLLYLIILLPAAAFLLLAFFGSKMPRSFAGVIGVGFTAVAALLTIIIGWSFINSPPEGYVYTQQLWKWIDLQNFQTSFSLHLDSLSLVFVFVITFVGSLILLYSTEFMRHEEGFARFFAFMNLFIASMLMLVLADNLLLLYLGWEGVGLCSYLLIGFWYRDPANGHAAQKAFIVTRIGDTAMALGLFLLFTQFGTLNLPDILHQAPQVWNEGDPTATLAALLLLGGAVGKSAQLPLQTWLPDAMAGPSPVSALIHAATMVTAGVYLIARTNILFDLAPAAQMTVGIIGGASLILAGFSALVQKDIKKVLAYSTISQIGYMFLALGAGALSAAIFHFMVHAFFKALLFLGAGALIMVLHHEHNMFRMGGLRKKLPVVFWTFLIASASLAALPLVSAGFYSKDLILWQVFASTDGGTGFWLLGFIGAFITAIYTFRMVFVTFFGKAQMEPERRPGWKVGVPLIILAILSFGAGFIELPHTLGHFTVFSDFIENSLPAVDLSEDPAISEGLLQIITALIALGGIGIAWWLYLRKRSTARSLRSSLSGAHGFLRSGWKFDRLYHLVFVKPFTGIARINKNDFIDSFYTGISKLMLGMNRVLSANQNGKLRWYMAGIAVGAVMILSIILIV